MDNDRILSPSAGPSGSSSLTPIPTFQVQSLINDTPTELVVQTFDDRILVIVTQNGKVGCLVCPININIIYYLHLSNWHTGP